MGDYGISRFGKKNSAPGNGQCFLTAHFQYKKITRSLFSLHFQLKVSLTKSTNDLQFACSAVYHSLRHNLFVHTLRALKSWVLKQNWLIRLSALDGTPKQNTTWKSQYLWVKLTCVSIQANAVLLMKTKIKKKTCIYVVTQEIPHSLFYHSV